MLNNVATNLTFKTTAEFRHWLKKQVKTSFSVPIQTKGSKWSFQYISVTKRALSTMHINDNEVINVEIEKAKRGDKCYAFVEPKRVESL
tara:strand:+ start:796 stop:1062 length:267 start_codon:yes stop_codon:yes gene_type:complete